MTYLIYTGLTLAVLGNALSYRGYVRTTRTQARQGMNYRFKVNGKDVMIATPDPEDVTRIHRYMVEKYGPENVGEIRPDGRAGQLAGNRTHGSHSPCTE